MLVKESVLYIIILAYNEEVNIEQCINDWYPIVENYCRGVFETSNY